ncbi:hypothetical protein [Sphingomonas sp.]|uniref:hypothetical protein n=1 Tax=Sphingomonas sp. TaxID=28214 RepID=UPI001B1B95D1|nr:hypothetical protein [Sphingomonas sp.]MBO9713039.1 hypothetical protein [Sphingomonas sp.]
MSRPILPLALAAPAFVAPVPALAQGTDPLDARDIRGFVGQLREMGFAPTGRIRPRIGWRSRTPAST